MVRPRAKKPRGGNPASPADAARRSTRKVQLPRPEEGNLGPKDGVPRSFVLHSGVLTPAGRQLLSDLRGMLAPYTAEKLRQNRTNTLKDFVSAASIFGVTHLLMLAQPAKSRSRHIATPEAQSRATDMARLNLRIGALPRGPTLTFRVNKYALRRDIGRATKRPSHPNAPEYLTPPLLVLSGFKQPEPAPGDHAARDALRALSLVATTLQRLFPAVNPAQMRLGAARRVVLVHYHPATQTLDWRHYLVTVRPTGVSKRLRKVVEGQPGNRGSSSRASSARGSSSVPDLGRVHDISDYVLGHSGAAGDESSYESDTDVESDMEGENGGKIMELFDSYAGRGNHKVKGKHAGAGGHTRAVRLTETGPRMELRLIKVQENLNGGQVLWHDRIRKTPAQVAEQKRARAEAEATRSTRRAEQEANVLRKRRAQWDAKNETRMRQGLEAIPYPEDEKLPLTDEEDEGSDAHLHEEGHGQEGEDDDEFAYEDAFGDQAQAEEEELYQLSDREPSDTENRTQELEDKPESSEDDEVQKEGQDDQSESTDDDEDEDSESDLSPIEAGAAGSDEDSASESDPEPQSTPRSAIQGQKRKREGKLAAGRR